MSKALVIGGNGFIGSHLVDALDRRGWPVDVFDLHPRAYDDPPERVHFIQGDLNRSKEAMRELVEGTGAEVVFHLAWNSIHETSLQDPATDLATNLTPSIQIMQACTDLSRKLIFLSSGGTVYGPTTQTHIPETHPLNPISSYGIGKLTVEKYLEMYHHLYGLDYAVLRPSVPFGPRQDYLKRQGAVAVFLYRISQGLPVTIWGDGNNVRDFFYITDLVEAILQCAEHEFRDRRIFNVGGSEGISLNRLVDQAEKATGKKAVVEHQARRPFDPPQVILDTTLIRNELGWVQQTPFSEGVQKTWDWIAGTLKERK